MKKVISVFIRDNKKLRQDIENLKPVKMQEGKTSEYLAQAQVYAEADEAFDRMRRARNVFIRGVPQKAADADQQMVADDDVVTNLISTAADGAEYNIQMVTCLDKFNSNQSIRQ